MQRKLVTTDQLRQHQYLTIVFSLIGVLVTLIVVRHILTGTVSADLTSLFWLLDKLERLSLLALLVVGGSSVLMVSVKYHVFKHGFKLAWHECKIRREVNTALLDMGAYVHLRSGADQPLVRLPDVLVSIDSNGKGIISIANSAQLSSKLENADFNASIKSGLVDEQYFSETGNDLIIVFTDINFDGQLKFNSLADYRDYVASEDMYHVQVDGGLKYVLCHSLITGLTGSGKSYALYHYILTGLIDGWDMYLVDPKNSSVSIIGEKIGSEHVAVKFDEVVELFNRFNDVVNQRKQELVPLLKQGGLDKDYSQLGIKPKVLFVDEFARFVSVLQTKDKKTRDSVMALLNTFILEGRQLGCFVIIAMQKSDAALISTLIRENMPFKCVLGASERQTYVTTFGNANVPKRRFSRGHGVYTLAGSTVAPRTLSYPKLNFDILKAVEQLTS